jgi:5-methylcytosine-specific restriction endonuclease McrA
MASTKDRLRAYLEKNVGKMLTHRELAPVGKTSSWPRRLRELRDDEGMQILSHRDRADLKPGEYILVSLERRPARARRIDRLLRTQILERDGFTCQTCGAAAGDPDPQNPDRMVRLHVDHVDPDGPTEERNLRTLCSACNEGRSNLSLPASTVNLLAVVRRAPRADQLRVYEWLRTKFE